jgi:hypothetical protein
MQVGAEHRIDAFWRIPCTSQILQKGVMHIVENFKVAFTIIADARIDHDSAIGCFNDKALPGDKHLAISVKEVGL